jgi:hypothetical protein
MAHVPGTDGSLVLILLMHHPVVYIYLIPGAQGVKRAMGLAILWHGEEQAGCEQRNVPGDVKITSSSLPPSLIVISCSPCSPDPHYLSGGSNHLGALTLPIMTPRMPQPQEC